MYVPGYAVKVLINGGRFAVKGLNWRVRIPGLQTTNNEGAYQPVATPGTTTVIAGVGTLMIDFDTPSWDTTQNPFLAPFSVVPGTYITIQVLPAGIGGVSLYSPSFYVEEGGYNHAAEQLAPGRFSGQGNGNWSNPTS